jgi:glycosyltransferase involved in cell wall biosynthesis
MKISIITINFNDRQGLQKTLDSVFTQSFQDFEYILIDGGSTDGSKELIESHSEKFSYWVSEADSGIYNAINKGLGKITSDYVLILNAGDCLYSQSTLSEMVPHLASGEEIIYGDSLDVNLGEGRPDIIISQPDELTFFFFFEDSLRHQSIFIKRSLHEKLGLYDEKIRIHADWKFLLQALIEEKVKYKHVSVTVCSFDRSGISSTNLALVQQEREEIMQELFPLFKRDYEELQKYKIRERYVPPLPIEVPRVYSVKFFLKMILPYGLVKLIQRARK